MKIEEKIADTFGKKRFYCPHRIRSLFVTERPDKEEDIPILYRRFLIKDNIDLQPIEAAAYKVCRLEEDILIQGNTANGTDYDIKGLYQSAEHEENTEALVPRDALKKFEDAAILLLSLIHI